MFFNKTLQQYLAIEDREAVRDIVARFEDPEADARALAQAANDPATLRLEKKYVPLLNKGASPVSGCDVLVCTVGFRPAPVILSTLMLKPKELYLLHSSDSRRHAETVRDDHDVQRLGLHPDRDIHLREISLTNAPENYEVMKTIVARAQDKRIVVDVSGGVKVMGVSLAAAAFWQRLPVIYLLGQEVKGIIKPFTEELKLLQNPYDHFGDTEFKLLKALFDVHNYDAALEICVSLRETVADVSTLGMLDILEEFIKLYRDWDAFAHSWWEDSEGRRLGTRLRVLIGKMERFNVPLAALDQLRHNLTFLEAIEQSWQANRRNLADEQRLIDIFCAAQRRARAGKFDDAIARLYRCLEMSATILLKRDWDIGDPKKPNLDKLAQAAGGQEALGQNFQRLARYERPERLGLNDQMTLLEIGGKHKTVCGIYQGISAGETSLMEHRNRSTLAHGTVPVSEAVYTRFSQKTEAIISWVVGKDNLAELLNQATHPSLTLLRASN